ncbi:MAG TPA: hypothetical protein VF062_23470 [Candidatus Limnocylindrales bacterium]
MARTAAGAALTQRHRAVQLSLRAATVRDLVTLWGGVDPTNLAGTIGRFTAGGTALVRAQHQVSATAAGRYLGGFRLVELGTPGAAARLAAALPADVVAGALRGAGLAGIINARRAGFSPAAAARNGLVKVIGQAASLVFSGARDTLLATASADPRSERWERVTGPDPCDFCAMLAGRGAVFLSEQTADFEAHDHCACMAEPQFG